MLRWRLDYNFVMEQSCIHFLVQTVGVLKSRRRLHRSAPQSFLSHLSVACKSFQKLCKYIHMSVILHHFRKKIALTFNNFLTISFSMTSIHKIYRRFARCYFTIQDFILHRPKRHLEDVRLAS